MKTIAIPLLLASSAKAEGAKQQRQEMDRDHATPPPQLIASSVMSGACQDSANLISDAETAGITLQTESAKLATDYAAADAEVVTAQGVVTAAIAAVNALAATHDASIAADDAAQATKLNADRVWNERVYEEAIALTAKTAAAAALVTQTAAQTTRTALVAALLEAKTEATSHYDAEVAAKIVSAALIVTEQGNLDTFNAATAALESTLTTATANWKTVTDLAATNLVLKTTAINELAEALVIKTTYANDIDSSISSSAAKNLVDYKTDDFGGANQLSDWFTLDAAITSADSTWQTAAQLTVTKLTDWNSSTSYTALASGFGCVDQTATAIAQGAAASVANAAACQVFCEAKDSWTMDTTVPTGSLTAGAAYCFGYEYVSTGGSMTCKLQTGAQVTVGSSLTDATCYVRDKTTKVADYITVRDLSQDSAAAYTAVNTAWTNALATRTQVQVLTRLVDVATAANTAWLAKYGASASAGYQLASATATTAYTTAQTAADTATNVVEYPAYTTANTAVSTNATNIGLKTTAVSDATIADTAVGVEVANQLTTKTLSESQYTAANAEMIALHTSSSSGTYATTQVNTDATTTATTYSTATAATATALQAQTAAITAATTAASTASAGRALLVTARLATTNAYVALADKQSNASSALSTLNLKGAAIAANAAELQGLIATCEAARYDEYAAALVTAQETRASNLAAIERLIATAETNAPAAGAAGYRCEKAVSFGTQRPARGETTCAAELCCGAARIPLPGQASTTMTVETCQPLATTEYSWTPPRAAMSTTAGAPVAAPFACIDGARKLVAAASVLATAVYMLA